MMNDAIEVLGWTLLHFVWQGTVVGVLAAMMLLALRRRSANARYLTAVSALGLMLLLPLGTIAWIVQTPPDGDVSPIFNTVSMVEIPRTREDGTLALDEPPIKVERIGIDFENPPPADAVPLIPVSEAGQTILEDLAEQRSESGFESSLKPFIPWAVAAWLIGVGVLSLRLFASWLSVQRLRRRATQPASENWQTMLRRIAEQLRVTRPVKLVESALVEVPTVIGWLSPLILLPASAMTGLTTEQLEALLAHELAHVRRHDYLVNLLQTVVETLLFYHPAVWWLSHRIRVEREHCCDDLAASVCGDRLSYAKALVAMEELRAPPLGLTMSARGGSLLSRVARLLRPTESQRQPVGWLAGLIVMLTLTLAGALGAGLLTPPNKPTEGLPNNATTIASTSNPADEETSGPTQRQEQKTPPEQNAETTDSKPAKSEAQPEKNLTHPITVTGRAFGPEGQPIVGAKIYIASVRGDYKRLAETTTDAEGRYAFRDVPLPILTVAPNRNGRDSGVFELFGQADGFGFTWRPMATYFPNVDPPITHVIRGNRVDDSVSLRADGAIVSDLKFLKPASLTGRIVDEAGRPVVGVELAMRLCDQLVEKHVEDGTFFGDGFSALNQPDDVPAEMKIRHTDSDGRFEFSQLPPGCLFRFDVTHPDYARKSVFAATTDKELPKLGGRDVVFSNKIELTMATVQEVRLRVLLADTEQPGEKVLVAVAGRDGADSAWKTSDDQGFVTLRLPNGEYRVHATPAKGTPYLETNPIKKLIVGDTSASELYTVRLKRGCTLSATIVDADTGAGIPDVDLWWNEPDDEKPKGRRGVTHHSWLAPMSHVERPTTDKSGKLKVVVEPGRRRFGAGLDAHPKAYHEDDAGTTLDCRPGETVEITLRLRPRRDGNQEDAQAAGPVKSERDEENADAEWSQDQNGLRTRLALLSEEPVVGRLVVKLEVQNIGMKEQSCQWMNRVAARYFRIIGPDGKDVEDLTATLYAQLHPNRVRPTVISPGETKVLLEYYDIAGRFLLAKPGQYQIRFGRSVDGELAGKFKNAADDGIVPIPEPKPLTVQLGAGELPEIQAFALRMRTVLPAGWKVGVTGPDEPRREDTAHMGLHFDPPNQGKNGELLVLAFFTEGTAPKTFEDKDVTFLDLGPTKFGRAHLVFTRATKAAWPNCVDQIRDQLPQEDKVDTKEAPKLTTPKTAVRPRKPDTKLGRFIGRVRLKLDGDKPLPDLQKVEVPAGKVLDESLVFSKEGGLANVFVSLWKPKFKIEPATEAELAKPFVLMAENGKFWPHAALVRVGRPVVFENGMAEPINFVTQPLRNLSFNVLVKPEDRFKATAFEKSENIPFPVKCTIQPWMLAHLLPVEHPFAALTGDDGRFEINGLPPGEHEFRVWHERVGWLEKSLKVTIQPSEEAKSELEYTLDRFKLTEADVLAWGNRLIDAKWVPRAMVPRPAAPKKEGDDKVEAAETQVGRDELQAAQKSAAVAKAEYEKILESNRRVPGSIPGTEVERARATYEKALLVAVRLAVEQAVTFLKAQQQENGAWQGTPADGVTALCAAALLQAGVKADDPVTRKALAHLRTIKPTLSYTVALQTMVFCSTSPKEDAELIRKNVAWLEKAQIAEGKMRGAWGYGLVHEGRGDGSCSRFAVMGLHAAKKAGFDVQAETWWRISAYWLTTQKDEGGWGYAPESAPTPAMTLAGVASLAAANRYLPQDEQTRTRDAAMLKPARYLEKTIPELTSAMFAFYSLHSLERAGHLSGLKEFGKLDWKSDAIKRLLEIQQPNGSWKASTQTESDLIATSFALLVLTGQPEQKPALLP